ncbi:SASB hydrolase, partial [Upupa epops]|nr:SASB hydrolase [Upupa epops]
DTTSELIDQVYNEYIGNAENPAQVRDGLLNALEDSTFVLPSVEVARYHRDAGYPVYFYQFQHRPSSADGVIPEFVRADHGDEIAFVFGKPFLAGDVSMLRSATEEETKLSRTIMRYWTNFARNGNPNGEGLASWPQYDLDEKYLEIDLVQKVSKKLKESQMEFWMRLFKQMRNKR